MKKQGQPRPKAKQHRRTHRGAAEPTRARPPTTRTIRLERLVLRQAGQVLTARAASAARTLASRTEGLAAFARKLAPRELAGHLRRFGAEARAISIPYSRDEREALALLFLPFLLVASAIVLHQSVRALQGYIVAIAVPDDEAVPVRPHLARDLPLTAIPGSIAREQAPDLTTATSVREDRTDAPSVAGTRQTLAPQPALTAMPSSPATSEAHSAAGLDTTGLAEAPLSTVPPAEPSTTLALLAPAGDMVSAPTPAAPESVAALDVDEDGKPIRPGICAVAEMPRAVAAMSPAPSPAASALDGETFGLRLAEAAESQVGSFVIYNDAYRNISYPMGDVNPLFGVCTDVVVRAYRTLGLDLQVLVHQARAGRGDTSIDQRRTEVLRRFFAAQGETLPVTTFGEDYRPGDVVTYDRPQNRGARAHIAVVSTVVAPSGRLMIVHNRGWGPQLEDALFVDRITGHYRYAGPPATRNAARDAARQSPIESPPTGRLAKPPSSILPASFATRAAPATPALP
ncbi:MAG: DUF1287 domain-containing protein [Hyphomicrobium sp.]|uniref:DUF1287 domain-containing protein n=1 Tax=Hyphomicrobium sp. TaxID=82 RepID=UPI003D0C254B